MNKEDRIITAMGICLALFLFLFIRQSAISGYVTETSTSSNVTITKYLSISMSGNLTDGITFGSVDTLPAVNINATDNNGTGGVDGNTTMFINVSSDSNTPVDFCIKANAGLIDSTNGNIIGLANETFLNSSLQNPSPATSGTILTTSYLNASQPTGQGNVTYFRFWLDVPSIVQAGSYNNSISFKGVATGLPC